MSSCDDCYSCGSDLHLRRGCANVSDSGLDHARRVHLCVVVSAPSCCARMRYSPTARASTTSACCLLLRIFVFLTSLRVLAAVAVAPPPVMFRTSIFLPSVCHALHACSRCDEVVMMWYCRMSKSDVEGGSFRKDASGASQDLEIGPSVKASGGAVTEGAQPPNNTRRLEQQYLKQGKHALDRRLLRLLSRRLSPPLAQHTANIDE